MKTADKYEALRRIPEYIEDWKGLQKLSGTIESEQQYQEYLHSMKQKYGIQRLPVPLEFSHKTAPYLEPGPVDINLSIENDRSRKITRESFVTDGHYLQVRINLKAPLPTIIKAVSNAVKMYRQLDPEDTNRSTTTVAESKVGLWNIYDLHINQGEPYEKIALGVQASCDPVSRRMQIYRTVKKARDIIATVKRQIKKEIKLSL